MITSSPLLPHDSEIQAVLPPAPVARLAEPRQETPAEFSISLNPAKILKVQLLVVACLGLAGAIASPLLHFMDRENSGFLYEVLRRIDLDYDLAFAQLYETTMMLACAGVLAVIAVAKKRSGCRWTFHWAMLAVIFLYLGIDDGTNLHELFTQPLRSKFGAHGLLFFAWVIPFGLFALGVGLAYLRFLLALDRRSAVLFALSGATFIFGVLVMEMIDGALADRFGVDSLQYIAGMILEQTLQYAGITLFLYGLLEHIRTRIGPLRIGWPTAAKASP